jgi:general secretion pathway protein A
VLIAGIAGLLYFQPWGQVGTSSPMSEKPALAQSAGAPTGEQRITEPGETQIQAAIDMPVIAPSPVSFPGEPAAESLSAMPEPRLTATAPVPPEPTLDSLLGTADHGWNRDAWKALFARWSVVPPPASERDYCAFAAANGLHCLDNNGTWESLRLFDRPAILKLETAEGRQIPVLLQHLDDGMAELNVAGSRHRMPVEEIDAHWNGEFVLLLKKPPGGTMYMEVGGRGTDVGWLREQLENIQGVDLASDDPLFFDYRLYKQVLTFQRDNGLATDGIVGRHTLILLNTHSQQSGIPRLSGVTS